ncbi:hypothetical protein BOX15_Mlig008180g2 [Macrostomum lignano]|uniref:EMI domain-containing protein n=1 Tax=Macrostomum lignano TaxID=282301 RepID=A0A267GDF5_9PLAT|nr:hypothetical protein BOX15_Mlig008180g1 [Macrostomum lignano]PAA83339.1 hypothetical protein BOX15_Mlig008180g2 [Macrostomum lignano]
MQLLRAIVCVSVVWLCSLCKLTLTPASACTRTNLLLLRKYKTMDRWYSQCAKFGMECQKTAVVEMGPKIPWSSRKVCCPALRCNESSYRCEFQRIIRL